MYFKISTSTNEKNSYVTSYAGGILSESVINTKTIFSYNSEMRVVRMYDEVISETTKSLKTEAFVNGIFFGIAQIILYLLFATIFYAAGSFMVNNGLSLKNMLRVFYCIFYGAFAIGMAQKYVSDLSKAKKSLNSIFKTLDTPSTIDPLAEDTTRFKPDREQFAGEIEFRGVDFSYPNKVGPKLFNNLNFKILQGQSAAFVGGSGSGKSTIIQLLERFYDVSAGKILIDGVDIREYDICALRGLISLVSQEPSLFKRSVYENIKYGKLSSDAEDIVEAARNAKIEKKVNLEIIEGDAKVSGGEKQRVAIARAMIKDPRILLLDEATSALDRGTEKDIQDYLDEAMQGRTSIVVAHRLTTIEKCDVIFVLNKGEIIEHGSHNELMMRKGKYFELQNTQTK
jgi:ATP-binding cassette subfamily B (MDR/TAP) protein 1